MISKIIFQGAFLNIELISEKTAAYWISTQCAGGGGLEKVPILKQLLHFSGQSDGGEW